MIKEILDRMDVQKNDKAWGGRFQKKTNPLFESFSESIYFDWILYNVDIDGSLAHVSMLCEVGLITMKEKILIKKGLEKIRCEIEEQGFDWFDPSLEDVHMNIECRLIEKIGVVGEKLHTGRSRNDQVVLDLRMKLKQDSQDLSLCLCQFMQDILNFAEKNFEIVIPEMTHMQHAQPVLLAHHLLAYMEMFDRDRSRIEQTYDRIDVMPLGSGACVGTGLPLDREFVRKQLGFSGLTYNSVDAVSDRDFVVEFLSNLSLMALHLSRWAEEWILWATTEFSFLTLGDEYCTGSSMMPQKKNADSLELIRAQSSRVYGDLFSLLTLLKGLPLAYNRDMQDDKIRLFSTCQKMIQSLKISGGVISGARVNSSICQQKAWMGFSYATDISDYLVQKKMSFRQSHRVVGLLVSHCIRLSCEVSDLSLKDLKSFSELFDQDFYKILSLQESLSQKNTVGGTAPQQVQLRMQYWKKKLKELLQN